jgi:hypothetical protein
MLKQTILSPSTDAVNWTTNASPAYSLNLSFSAKQLPPPPFGPGPGAGGGHHVVTVQRRERPELVFARPANLSGPAAAAFSTKPLLLLNGVQAQCKGVPACERVYGNCSLGAMGNCSQTVSVTVATALKLHPVGAKTDDDERGPKVGKYTEHHNKNCCPGAGGRVMDGGNHTLMTVQQCEAHCDASPACHCIVISSNATAARGGGPGQCFRRSSCNPAGCQFDARFNAFIKPGGAPVPAPPPPAPAPRFPPKHGSICKDCKFDAVCRVE